MLLLTLTFVITVVDIAAIIVETHNSSNFCPAN